MKALVVLASGLLLTASLSAAAPANGKPQSSITVTVDGLSCTAGAGAGAFAASSWSVGGSNTVVAGGGGGAAGKVSLQDLNLAREADGCSPALLGAMTNGRHFTRATLTQHDADGVATATLTLTDVLFSSWNLSGRTTQADVVENVSITFTRICFADVASGASFCYPSAAP